MSLAIPTAQEYRATLERLAAEHARRRMAEQELARMKDAARKRSDAKPRDWSWAMYDAAELMRSIPADPPEVVSGRRARLSEAVS